VATVFAVLGGALVAVGSLLDWSGVSYSSQLDRGLAVAAGVLLLIVAALGFAWHRRILIASLAPAALALNMGIVNYNDITNGLYEYAAYPDAEVGVGLYLVIVGSVVAIAAGMLALVPPRWVGSSVNVEPRNFDRA
jgi:hypothetical protein